MLGDVSSCRPRLLIGSVDFNSGASWAFVRGSRSVVAPAFEFAVAGTEAALGSTGGAVASTRGASPRPVCFLQRSSALRPVVRSKLGSAVSSRAASSLADCGRWAGDFSKHRRTMRSSSRGIETSELGAGGAS